MDFLCSEGPVLKASESEVESGQMLWKNTLIGRIQTGDKYSFEPSKTMKEIEKTWVNLISTFTMMELDDNCISFTFENEEDKKWVMDSRPWLISGEYLLVLTDQWVPNVAPSKIEFKTCPFWIQAHNVPYELMSKVMGERIGKVGGKVLGVDFNDMCSSRERKKYLRIRVLVDVTERLATGCWLCIAPPHDDDANEKNKNVVVLRVSFRYEALPNLCYKCGVIGHSEAHCCSNIQQPPQFENYIFYYLSSEEIEIPMEGEVLIDPGKMGYGPWLKYEVEEEKERVDSEVHDHEDGQDEMGIESIDTTDHVEPVEEDINVQSST